jgi:hypothetical protein
MGGKKLGETLPKIDFDFENIVVKAVGLVAKLVYWVLFLSEFLSK